MFLVKYSPTGTFLWARRAGASYSDQGWSVSTDDLNNVYVTGQYNSPSIIFDTDTLHNFGGPNIFIAKYSPSGNVLWARSEDAGGYSEANSIICNRDGNIVITGEYGGLGDLVFGSDTLPNLGYDNIFIAAFSSSGTPLWARSANGNGNSYSASITADATGDLLITGHYYSPTLSFGTTTLTNTTVSGSMTDLFIAKYSSTGTLLWAKSAGGPKLEFGTSITTDASGNIYSTGYFNSAFIALDSDTIRNSDASANTYDAFILKYSATGAVLNAKAIGISNSPNNGDRGWSVASDFSGIYLSGEFTGSSIIFDSDTLFFPSGSYDPMFIVKYDTSLNVICASELASGGDDWSPISTDGTGNVYIAGDIYGNVPVIVGPDTLSTQASSYELFFIAKYNCGTMTNIINITNGENEISATISPNPSPGLFYISAKEEITSVIVYNYIGEKVFTSSERKDVIDLSKAAAGIYFYSVTLKDGAVAQGKIIVAR